MNSDQIDRILQRTMGSSRFAGVFAADTIPQPRAHRFPYGVVVNTDKMGGAGLHWQAIWMLGPKRAEFFDSFGDEPPPTIARYFHTNHIHVKIKNKKKIQANYEVSCGPFVIYYLVQRARGARMSEIVARLARNKFVDTYVKLFVSSLLL
jgi:hypothetical protein